MDNIWLSFARQYIECFKAINKLKANGLLDDERVLKCKLLDEIIKAMEWEVKESEESGSN